MRHLDGPAGIGVKVGEFGVGAETTAGTVDGIDLGPQDVFRPATCDGSGTTTVAVVPRARNESSGQARSGRRATAEAVIVMCRPR